MLFWCFFFFFQAEDGIRDVERSRGLGDVYKRQAQYYMSDINKVILIGRLTRDPEIRYTNSGTPVVTISLAVNRKTSTENSVDFIDVVLWKKLAELSNRFLKKGSQVAVDGRLQVRTYESDSGKRKIYEVVASSLQFLDRVNNLSLIHI
eukprot:TRINITY_DN28689_c0_g1_i1.p1 TRINITY_DN28689_c0_g1~~TRINITY_DN28689_c0_g1_i1.p1  ORF type:complete len:149 (+),score=33.89 TRINITY_DN28689_c0_g1_i1:69-515(+)